jgi:hypothetical protein
MGALINKWLAEEAKRLRREADALELKDPAYFATVIRIYRNDAARKEAELEGAQE